MTGVNGDKIADNPVTTGDNVSTATNAYKGAIELQPPMTTNTTNSQ